MSIKYTDIVPWGRSYDEYIDMFLLSEEDLRRKIIGVGDGPASFNACMHRQGRDIVSVDPLYRFSEKQIRNRIQETRESVVNQTEKNKDKFVWTKIPSLDILCRIRLTAMEEFCRDFELGKRQGRYINGALPIIPFPDKSFDLVLTSHLLFFYSANLNLNFHIRSIKELIRIGSEVRIFPIIDLNSKRSPHLSPVLKHLANSNTICTIERVRYHFQKTGNEMLRVICKENA